MFDRLRRGRRPRLGALIVALVAVVSLQQPPYPARR